MKTPFEKFEEEMIGKKFTKSFQFLNHNPNLNHLKKKLIEVIYSFNQNGDQFYKNYDDVAKELNTTPRNISQLVIQLKKLNYISTDNTKNYKAYKDGGGSSTSITLNIQNIIDDCSIPEPIFKAKEKRTKTKKAMNKDVQKRLEELFAKKEAKEQTKPIEEVVTPSTENKVETPTEPIQVANTSADEVVDAPEPSTELFNVKDVLKCVLSSEEHITKFYNAILQPLEKTNAKKTGKEFEISLEDLAKRIISKKYSLRGYTTSDLNLNEVIAIGDQIKNLPSPLPKPKVIIPKPEPKAVEVKPSPEPKVIKLNQLELEVKKIEDESQKWFEEINAMN
ncbi:hypothetical protein [Psychroserpens mesophilus]|uniref:hypothetical protein n=1 Tax=Psychroserpens mesophilus TaxID=325473 RepID=UPI003D6515E0